MSGRPADTACWGRCHAPIKSRRISPTGDERHSERWSGPTADSLKESQLAAGQGAFTSRRTSPTKRIETASLKGAVRPIVSGSPGWHWSAAPEQPSPAPVGRTGVTSRARDERSGAPCCSSSEGPSGQRAPKARQTAPFVDEQQPPAALLLLVPSRRLVDVGGDDRIRPEAAARPPARSSLRSGALAGLE